MKKIIIAASIVFCFFSAPAQFTYDYLKAADGYYKKGDWFSAAQYYEKYLESKDGKKEAYNPYVVQTSSSKKSAPASSREQAIYNLAESYRMLNFHVKSEPYYRQTLEFDPGQFPLARYHYATTLRALAKYDEAEKTFNDFLALYKTEDIYSESANREILNLRFIQQQMTKKDLNLYSVNKAGAELNTTGANYAPSWLNESTLLFTSTRPEDAAIDKGKTYLNRIYTASHANGQLSAVAKAELAQEKDIHQGVTAVTPDGNTMFLTRWTIDKTKKTATLYKSIKTGNNWSEPVMLSGDINAADANTQQPFVSPDGKQLWFASDRSGGQGGFDLWYAELDAAGNTGKPINAGTTLNTKWDEQAPYYHAASNTLVFSSNGRAGMGGYDFFHTKGVMNNWAVPMNFGYPVNSIKDDIYFASKGSGRNILENVFLSSDRSAECCLELFFLKKIKPMKELRGLVIACDTKKPIQGATVNIVDPSNNKNLSTIITDNNGNYIFSFDDFQQLQVTASSTGYIGDTLSVSVPDDMDTIELANPVLCLNTPEVDQALVLENIYFDFNKADLKEESFPVLDELVTILNDRPQMTIELSAHTDSKGTDTYNDRLSQARAESVMKYLMSKGIDASRLEAKGYGETAPLASNTNDDGTDNPDGRQKNRRTEFKILKK